MAEGNRQNYNKDRKSEAQKRFDAANNAGRFAGDDADSKSARNEAIENIRQDTSSGENNNQNNQKASQSDNNRYSDAEARRDPAQSHDYKAEAQNVNDDTGRPLSDEETPKAKNKATEGLRQGRQDTGDSTNI